MYKIKRKNGSLPKWLRVQFTDYYKARNALRRYLAQQMLANKHFSKNLTMQYAEVCWGLSVSKV